MASISGGQFHFSTSSESVPGASQHAGAGPLSLASIANFAATIGGGSGSGFDSINSGSAGGLAGHSLGSSDSVVTTHTSGGNTVVHLPDGSSLTVVGTTHIDGFFH